MAEPTVKNIKFQGKVGELALMGFEINEGISCEVLMSGCDIEANRMIYGDHPELMAAKQSLN